METRRCKALIIVSEFFLLEFIKVRRVTVLLHQEIIQKDIGSSRTSHNSFAPYSKWWDCDLILC